ncbi:MAG: DUF4159 domain-containing protein, partial [Planctomycetota bacterium]
RRNQREDGSWGYKHLDDFQAEPSTPGMTAAGVASLFITTDRILAEQGGAASCRGNWADDNLARGLAWLDANADLIATNERYDRDWPAVTLFTVERAAVAGGLRNLGGRDWFQRGASHLLSTQRNNGSWPGDYRPVSNVHTTALHVLFLARGQSPVMANKLNWSTDDEIADWNQRPFDLANLATYAGDGLERELHWQAIELASPVEQWSDAPMLYIAGSSSPADLPSEAVEKLVQFADRGGLVVANADCGRRPFADGFVKLIEAAYAERSDGDYTFRPLPTDHPIYRQQYDLTKQRRPIQLLGLSNGVRELFVLVPKQDLGRDWQTRRSEPALQLGTNLYLYAIDTIGMRLKAAARVEVAMVEPIATLQVGRVKWDGNWDPEPAGWTRINRLVNRRDLGVDVSTVTLADLELESAPPLLHLTGTGEFELENEEKLAAYVEAGGTLLIDAAGGDAAFADAAEAMLTRVFDNAGEALAAPIGETHPLVDGIDVEYRLSTIAGLGNARGPRLRVIEVGGRPAVIYSREDLTHGLLGRPTAGVFGYTPDTATAIVSKLVESLLE